VRERTPDTISKLCRPFADGAPGPSAKGHGLDNLGDGIVRDSTPTVLSGAVLAIGGPAGARLNN